MCPRLWSHWTRLPRSASLSTAQPGPQYSSHPCGIRTQDQGDYGASGSQIEPLVSTSWVPARHAGALPLTLIPFSHKRKLAQSDASLPTLRQRGDQNPGPVRPKACALISTVSPPYTLHARESMVSSSSWPCCEPCFPPHKLSVCTDT